MTVAFVVVLVVLITVIAVALLIAVIGYLSQIFPPAWRNAVSRP